MNIFINYAKKETQRSYIYPSLHFKKSFSLVSVLFGWEFSSHVGVHLIFV